jgi:branched-chain amino acid transport system substrate-binding protein
MNTIPEPRRCRFHVLRQALMLLILGLAPVAGVCARDDALVIGAVYNLHGVQANLDEPSSRGARLAIEHANREGGVLGRRVELAVVDGVSKPRVIGRKTRALLKRFPDMSAFLGLSDTDMVLAAAPVAAAALRVFLTSGATSPRLPQQVPEYLYLACFGDNVQAAAAAESAWLDLGARTAAVLYSANNTYTGLLQGYFRARFAELGGSIASVRSFAAGGIDDVPADLLDVDLVFLATGSPEETIDIVRTLRGGGVTAPVFGGDSYDSEALWAAPDVADGSLSDIYFTTHAYLGADSPDPRVQSFRDAYASAYEGREPDAFAALGYDAARLLIAAIEFAGNAEPASVRAALSDMPPFRGVTGTIDYTNGERIPSKSVTILRVTPGGTALFRQLVPERVPMP